MNEGWDGLLQPGRVLDTQTVRCKCGRRVIERCIQTTVAEKPTYVRLCDRCDRIS